MDSSADREVARRARDPHAAVVPEGTVDGAEDRSTPSTTWAVADGHGHQSRQPHESKNPLPSHAAVLPRSEPYTQRGRRIESVILVTGATGFVGPEGRARVARAGPARFAASSASRRERCGHARGLGLRARRGRRDRRREPRCAPSKGARPSSTSSRSARASDEQFRRVMEQATRDLVAVGDGGRRPPLRPDERARHERGDAGPRALLPRQVGDGAGRRGLRARVRDLPAELRLRARRRDPADVHAARAAGAGDADHRLRDAADPADLGRRRRRLLRGRGRPARGERAGSSSSAGRTP